STVEVTEGSWMSRFCATEITPAVRQLARPTRRYSIGVMPLSSAANVSGWSASKTNSVLWFWSAPRPKYGWILVVLWTPLPLAHEELAFQVNCAASGAPFSTSRASSKACTFTPFVAVVIGSFSPFSGYRNSYLDDRQYSTGDRLTYPPWCSQSRRPRPVRSARSRRNTSICRNRSSLTAGESCTRFA